MISIFRPVLSKALRHSFLKLRRLGLIAAVCLLPMACDATERIQPSPEEVAARAIAAWTKMCVELNGGEVPGSWADFRSALKMSVDEILDTVVPTKRYAILMPPIRLTPPLQGELVAVNRSGIMDIVTPPNFPGVGPALKGPGRYVVYRDATGEFKPQWVTEDYITQAFAAADVPLPAPDSEPERAWVSNARQNLLEWRIGYGVMAVLAVVGVVLWRRGGMQPAFRQN
jgi:hypothetical protein